MLVFGIGFLAWEGKSWSHARLGRLVICEKLGLLEELCARVARVRDIDGCKREQDTRGAWLAQHGVLVLLDLDRNGDGKGSGRALVGLW